jgi:hypothetical protein
MAKGVLLQTLEILAAGALARTQADAGMVQLRPAMGRGWAGPFIAAGN